MKTHKLSRRRLLGGLLAALTAWLCPRPPRSVAAPCPPASTVALPPSQFIRVTTYTYDGQGRLVGVTDHPPRPIEPIHCTPVKHEHGGTYTYDLS